MKVLEKGNFTKPLSLKRRCGYYECKAKLLIEEEDIIYEAVIGNNDDDACSKQREYYGFECPECGEITWIKESLLPIRVKKLASDNFYEKIKNQGG